MQSPSGNTEFGLHVLKRRASGNQGDRYTIGIWDGTQQLAICLNACLDCALAALRLTLETPGTHLVVSAARSSAEQQE